MSRRDGTRHEQALTSLVEIGAALQRLNRSFERRLGLSIVQWCVLYRLLDLPAASAQSLARAVGVSPGTLTQSLRRLQRKGLVYVASDPTDARRKSIAATREGRDALLKAGKAFREGLARATAVSGELQAVRNALAEALPRRRPVERVPVS